MVIKNETFSNNQNNFRKNIFRIIFLVFTWALNLKILNSHIRQLLTEFLYLGGNTCIRLRHINKKKIINSTIIMFKCNTIRDIAI